MRPLPDLNDEAAMLKRGKQSALGTARNDAAEALRDAAVAVQSADWPELHDTAERASKAAERLKTIASMWNEL